MLSFFSSFLYHSVLLSISRSIIDIICAHHVSRLWTAGNLGHNDLIHSKHCTRRLRSKLVRPDRRLKVINDVLLHRIADTTCLLDVKPIQRQIVHTDTTPKETIRTHNQQLFIQPHPHCVHENTWRTSRFFSSFLQPWLSEFLFLTYRRQC